MIPCPKGSYAGYGFDKKVACASCRVPGMRDIANPPCCVEGCVTQGSFVRWDIERRAAPDAKPPTRGEALAAEMPIYCAKHIPSEQYIDTVNFGKRCRGNDCAEKVTAGGEIVQGRYRNPNRVKKRGANDDRRCRDCMVKEGLDKDGWMDEANRCEEPGCNKGAVFNLPGEKVGRWCCAEGHGPPEKIDVRSPKCIACKKGVAPSQAQLGLPGKGKTHCNSCAKSDTRLVRDPNKKCPQPHCRGLATFYRRGDKERDRVACEDCMPRMVGDFVCITDYDECKSCELQTILNDGFCDSCHPEVQRAKKYEKQDACVKAILGDPLLSGVFGDTTQLGDSVRPWWHYEGRDDGRLVVTTIDRTVAALDNQQGCTRKRPDIQMVIDDAAAIIIEIDEYFHRNLTVECEISRMKEIAEEHRGRPVLFIRFNPDGFKVNGNQVMVDSDTRHQRLAKLIRLMLDQWRPEGGEGWLAQPATDLVLPEVVTLYYPHERLSEFEQAGVTGLDPSDMSPELSRRVIVP